jgi:hypothetical protein
LPTSLAVGGRDCRQLDITTRFGPQPDDAVAQRAPALEASATGLYVLTRPALAK